MLSGHHNSVFAMFRRNSTLIDLIHCVLNYAVTFELQYNVQLLLARAPSIRRYMLSSWFMQNASLSACGSYTCIAKPFHQKQQRAQVSEQNNGSSANPDLGIVQINDATSFNAMKRTQGCWSYLQTAALTALLFLLHFTHSLSVISERRCSLRAAIHTIL